MQQLETARLILRPVRESDVDDLFEYACDPRVGPIAGWPIHKSKEETLEIIRTVFSEPRNFGMELKEGGKFVGTVGFCDTHQTLLPGPDDEIGYCLNPAYWGQGLVPEAVRELLRWGFEDLGLNTQWCAHFEGNDKSRRVIEKCGFRHQISGIVPVPLMGEERMLHSYALTREEWRP